MRKDILDILVHFGNQNHKLLPEHDKTAFEIMLKEELIVPHAPLKGYYDLTRKGQHLHDTICSLVGIVTNID